MLVHRIVREHESLSGPAAAGFSRSRRTILKIVTARFRCLRSLIHQETIGDVRSRISPLRRASRHDRRRAGNLLCRDLRRGDSTRKPTAARCWQSRESRRSYRGRGVGFEHPRRVASGHGFGRTAKAQAESRSPDCAGPPRVAGARHAHLAPAAECDPAGAGRDRTCCGSGRRRTSPRAITRHRPRSWTRP